MRDLYIKPKSGIVRNTDDSFVENAPITLEDYTFELQDENGDIIETIVHPAMTDQIILAPFIQETLFAYNLNVDGEFQEEVIVDVESDININIE